MLLNVILWRQQGQRPSLLYRGRWIGTSFFAIGTIAGFCASPFVMVENIVFRNRYLIYPSFPVLGKRRCLRQVVIPSVSLSFVPLLQLLLADFKLIVEQFGKAAVFCSQVVPYGDAGSPADVCFHAVSRSVLAAIRADPALNPATFCRCSHR